MVDRNAETGHSAPIMEAMIETIAVDIRSQPKSMSSKGIGPPSPH